MVVELSMTREIGINEAIVLTVVCECINQVTRSAVKYFVGGSLGVGAVSRTLKRLEGMELIYSVMEHDENSNRMVWTYRSTEEGSDIHALAVRG